MKSHSSEEGQRDSVSARTEWVQKLRMFMSLQERLGGYAHYSDDLKKILLPCSQISIQLLVVVIAIFFKLSLSESSLQNSQISFLCRNELIASPSVVIFAHKYIWPCEGSVPGIPGCGIGQRSGVLVYLRSPCLINSEPWGLGSFMTVH